MKHKIGCVLMASGDARRFGENKLNSTLKGESLIDRALNCLKKLKLDCVVVVSQYEQVLRKADAYGFIGVKNNHPDYGISHTIKLGLQKAQCCDAVMFMVSDQPLLTSDSVSGMIEYYRENPTHIVAMGYGGTRGNPCIFPSVYFDELKKLSEDNGGNQVIRAHEDRLLIFQASHPDELSDIDTKEDLKVLEHTEV